MKNSVNVLLAFLKRKPDKSIQKESSPSYDWEEIIRKEYGHLEEMVRMGLIGNEDYERINKNIQSKIKHHMGFWYYEP